jgi:signal transduction histidine kinase
MNLFSLIKIRTNNFSARVFIRLFIPVVLFSLILNFFFVQSQKKIITTSILEQGTAFAKLFAHDLRLDLFSEDHKQIAISAKEVFDQEGVILVKVYDKNGNILVKEEKQSCKLDYSVTGQGFVRKEKGLKAEASLRAFSLKSEDFLLFATPVFFNKSFSEEDLLFEHPNESLANKKEVLGYVIICISTKRLNKGINSVFIRAISITILSIIICGFITLHLVRQVSSPLNELIMKIKDKGIMVNTAEKKDDLDYLSDSFTSIISKLDQSFSIINDLNTGLEDKIEARTHELEDLNKSLSNRKKKLEKTIMELQETQIQLVQSEKMASLGLLVAGVAHEVNNSITFITGAMPALKKIIYSSSFEPEAEDDLKLLLNNIKEGTDRATRIVTNLKNFSRPGSSDWVVTDIHQGLDSTLSLLDHEHKGRIEIKKDYGIDIPGVKCIPGQLNQVFMNLLLNATQAITGKGEIKISTTYRDKFIHIKIKDNGYGISEANLKKIFDPFFTTKKTGEGTGLGLGISYKIIEQHQGEIKVKSSKENGTEFVIIIPPGKG